jgi:ribosomal protein S6
MPVHIPSSEDVRVYETAILYPSPMNQKEENELLKGIDEIFADAKATVVLKDAWGDRGLAYRIGGFDEANVLVMYHEIDPSKIKEIDRQLSILKGVLRHLIVKPVKKYDIAPMAGRLDQWKVPVRVERETRVREKEEKKLKQVVEKAKRAPAKPKKAVVEEKPMPTETIEQGVDKLLSDTDLSI